MLCELVSKVLEFLEVELAISVMVATIIGIMHKFSVCISNVVTFVLSILGESNH